MGVQDIPTYILAQKINIILNHSLVTIGYKNVI